MQSPPLIGLTDSLCPSPAGQIKGIEVGCRHQRSVQFPADRNPKLAVRSQSQSGFLRPGADLCRSTYRSQRSNWRSRKARHQSHRPGASNLGSSTAELGSSARGGACRELAVRSVPHTLRVHREGLDLQDLLDLSRPSRTVLGGEATGTALLPSSRQAEQSGGPLADHVDKFPQENNLDHCVTTFELEPRALN